MSHVPSPSMAEQDAQHVNVLAVFHYVLGGLQLALPFCLSAHLFMGLVFMLAPEQFNDDEMPREIALFFGAMFVVIPAVAMLAGWLLGALTIYAGRCLHTRRRYRFCFVIACIQCAFVPLGTVLGVFTVLVLMRPRVRDMFGMPPQ